jgi:hypothetical protein
MNEALAAAREVAAVWRTLGRRHWAVALAAGLVFGLGFVLQESSALIGDKPDAARVDIVLVVAIKFLPLYLVTTALLVPGLAALDRHGRGTTPEVVPHAVLVVVVALAGGVIGHWAHQLGAALAAQFGLADPYDKADIGWSGAVLFSLGRSINLLIALSLGTLVYLYIRNARRTARRLAAAQLRHAEAERRVLAEQLDGAQATVEPEFLFDTLQRVEALFEHDAANAQRLLEALIAYLRAALPAADERGSTLGRQADLLRARFEIERVRRGGDLRFVVDVPAALAERPLAPLLLAPLAANAIRHGLQAGHRGDVALQAREVGKRLVVEVSDSGPGRAADIRDGAGLAGVRERLARLYGERARLVLADREPRGLCARLEFATGADR